MELKESLYADRSERAKLRLTGPQRAWFLHQILTQSFEDIAPGETREAALLTPHGRMVGYLEVLATEDSLLAHFEPELRDSLQEAIRRYVLATRVEIEDITDQTGMLVVIGDHARHIVAEAEPDALFSSASSFGHPSWYVWLDREKTLPLMDALETAGARRALENELETLRIEAGMPRWGKDMNEKTLAPEAVIDKLAIAYDKGCYVGQEAIAKIHFRGKVNRRIRKLASEAALDAGVDVSIDGEKVGTTTSAAGTSALAMLRYTIEPGAIVEVGNVKAEVVG